MTVTVCAQLIPFSFQYYQFKRCLTAAKIYKLKKHVLLHNYKQIIKQVLQKTIFQLQDAQRAYLAERGGSVVTHETRIREVPGLNPGADRPDWDFVVVFLNHQGKCWVGFSLPRSIWPLFIKFIYHRINSVNLTIETLTTHNNRNTQPSDTHTKTLDAIWPRCWGVSK